MRTPQELDLPGVGPVGMTQAELGAALQVSRRTIDAWRRKGCPIAVSALLRACRRLEPDDPKRAMSELVESLNTKGVAR